MSFPQGGGFIETEGEAVAAGGHVAHGCVSYFFTGHTDFSSYTSSVMTFASPPMAAS